MRLRSFLIEHLRLFPFYTTILPDDTLQESRNLFKHLSFSFPFYRDVGCLCFRNGAFNRGLALIYFGNERVTTRWAEGAAVCFYWYVLQSHFAFSLFVQQSSPTFSLFTHRIPPLSLQFFILPSLSVSSLFLPFVPPHLLWTHDSSCSLEHRANYFLSGSVES